LKKFLLIITIICYAIASYGVSINYFYCCGKLKTINIINAAEKKQNSCKPKMGKDCCKYEKKVVKLKAESKQDKKLDIKAYELKANIVNVFLTYHFQNPLESKIVKQQFQLPPPKLTPNLNILYCTYRI
jgi:hypothetical protein